MLTSIKPTEESYGELSDAYNYFNERLFDGALPGCLITLQRKGRSLGYFSVDRFVNREGVKTDEIALNPMFFATRPVEDVLSTLAHEMCHQWRERTGDAPRRCYHDKTWGNKMEGIGLMPSASGSPGGKKTGEQMSHYILPDGLFIQACKELLASSFGVVWFDRFPEVCGKDYSYAGTIEVKKTIQDRSMMSSSLAAAGVQNGGLEDGNGEDDGVTTVEVPVFSPTPISAGLDVAVTHSGTASVGPTGQARMVDRSNRVKYSCPQCSTNAWGKPDLNIVCGDCSVKFEPAQ